MICILVGAAAGLLAAARTTVTWTDQAVLFVPAAGSQAAANAAQTRGPGQATEARVLASTYAASIPTDDAILGTLAQAVGRTPADVRQRLTVTNEVNTALLTVAYRGTTSTEAANGIRTVLTSLTTAANQTLTVGPGTLKVSQSPGAPQQTSSGVPPVPLGVVLGLLIGVIVAVARDRSDPRVDLASALSPVVGTPVTLLSAREPDRVVALAHLLADALDERSPIDVVPVRDDDRAVAQQLASALTAASPASRRLVYATSPVTATAIAAGDPRVPTGGTSILVVTRGAPVRAVAQAVSGAVPISGAPKWTVVVDKGALKPRRGALAEERFLPDDATTSAPVEEAPPHAPVGASRVEGASRGWAR